jgi:hypothetical protein
MVGAKTKVEPTADSPADKPPETQGTQVETPDTRTTLSQQATAPGDSTALRDVKPDQPKPEQPMSAGASESMPATEAPKPPTLDRKTLERSAEELHEALKRTGMLGLTNNPDKEKVFRILEPLSQSDRRALEQVYEEKFGDRGKARQLASANSDRSGIDHSSDFQSSALRREIADKFDGPQSVEQAKITSIMNRSEGKTNDAGALMVAISQTREDSTRGNVAIRAVFETLNQKQVQELEANFKRDYGKTWQEATRELGGDVTPQTLKSLEIFRKGVDQRTPQDVKDLTRLAIDSKDARLLGEVLRGDAPSTVQARREMLADRNFIKDLSIAFPKGQYSSEGVQRIFSRANSQGEVQFGRSKINVYTDLMDPIARDYLTEGRISLKSITTENTGKWILDAKDNINLAAKNASDSERRQFALGAQLTTDKRTPQTQEEKDAKAFYDKIHKVFTDKLTPREVTVAESFLKYGRENVLTDMASTHSEAWGPFGLGSGHSRQDLMSRAENLSEADYNLLRDPKNGKQFRDEIENSLTKYADEGERTRIMQMLKLKAEAPTYKDSQAIHRSLKDTIQDNKGTDFLFFGTSYDAKGVLKNLSSMTPKDAADLKADPKFAQEMRDFIKKDSEFSSVEQLYALRLIDKAAKTGEVPKPDETDKFLKTVADGGKRSEILAQAQKALEADPALRLRLSKPDNQLSAEDRLIKRTISETYMQAKASNTPYHEWRRTIQQDIGNFIATGKMTLQDKLSLGMDRKSIIESAAAASPEERAATRNKFTPTERQIIENAAASGGKLSLADRIQLSTMNVRGIETKVGDFKAELEEMHKTPEGLKKLQEAKDEFTRKYGRNMDDTVLSQVDDKQRDEFKRLLTPENGDGRQTFYDNVWKALRSDSGTAADGTYLTMQRSIDQTANSLEEYQRIYKTLPPEKQKALDEFFNQSWEQHKQSKEKLADLVITATITAAALATAPFTAGMSVAALAAWAGVAATAGAAFTVGTKMAFSGNDYDKSHMMRDIVHGAVAGGLIFAIPPIGRVTAVFGAGAKTILADGALATSVAGLNAAERAAMERVLAESLMKAGKEFSEQQALAVIKQAAPNLGAEATNKLATELVGSVTRNYGTAIDAGVQALNQQASEGGKQVAARFVKQLGESSAIGAGGNAVATLADAPFSENGLDLDNLRNQTLLGGGIGLVMPIAFKGIAAGSKYIINVSKEINAATGAVDVVAHGTPSEPVTVRRANGTTETITDKGRLMDGDTIVDGPKAPKTEPTPGETTSVTQTVTEAAPAPTDAPSGNKQGTQGDGAQPNRTDGSQPVQDGAPQTDARPSTADGAADGTVLRRNEKGQLVNEQGKLINERGQLINEEGKLVNGQGKLVNERGQTINERGEIIDSKGNLIENEFPAYSKSEFDRARPELVQDLHGWKTIDGKNVGEEFDALANKLGLSEGERNQILDGLQTVREHGTRMVDIDPEQAINWKHTQREFGAAVDYAARNNLSKAETQDLLLSAMFSDGLKTKFNFTTHNVDGATAFEHFAKTHLADMPADRIAGIRQAILEHQVAPPEFMAMIYGGAIQGSIKAEGGRAMTDAETTAFNSLKAKISNPFALGPDGLIDVPGGPPGAKAVKLTPDEQALLQRTGLDHWYVPNEGNAWNKFSRGLIDADGIDNYAGPGGLSKIIGLRGPGKMVFFQDRHVLYGNPENPQQISSVDSWKQSQRDFLGDPQKGKLGVATEQTRNYVEQQSARMQGDIDAAQGRVNEWINSPEGRKQLGLPAEGPIEKLPGWTGTKEKPDLIDYSTATPEELDRARKVWDRFSEELGREQRVNLGTTPEYTPAMQRAADVKAAEETANIWNARAKSTPDGVTLERAGTGENRWLVKRPDGTQAELHAEIKSNPDGSQTVKYITDQRADWYKRAYEKGAPETPMVREVTYHPDGTVTTKGFDSEFVPPEGSVLRKDARFGEYWSTPDGKQVWIDGERRVWNEVSKGVWHSKDGLLAENIEYVRKGLTTATPLDAPLEWTNSYNGVDSKMLARPGDYKIDEGGGKFYVVDKDVFERTYSKAPGTENQYIRNGVRARESHVDQVVQTRAGDVHAKKGDYLATGPDGEIYVIEREKFHNLYERNANQPPKPPEQFKMPAATGPSVENADGTFTMPYANGEIIWDKNKNIVTITDKLNGTSSTWSGEALASQGVRIDPITGKSAAYTEPVRFYFNNGAEERINSSGHRAVHTPDMEPGVFRYEDGAILRESGAEASPISAKPTTFIAGTDGATGARQLTDSEGRVWTESNGKWVNDNGSLSIDQNGYRFTWNDGSANWTDSDGKQWSRTSEDPPGQWRGAGGIYQEGTWNYTRRTKDDSHAPEILAVLSPAAVAAAVSSRVTDGSNSDSSQNSETRPGTEQSRPDTEAKLTVEGPSSAKDVEVKSDGSWTAKLNDGRTVTPDSPGPWEVQLKDGTTLRRHDNSLESRLPDGSGKVTIYDGKGGSKSFDLLPGGRYIDKNGKAMQYFSATETPPSTESFQFQKKATVKAEVATEPFEWKDWQGNSMQGAVGDIKVTQPDGSLSSVKPEIFNSTYSQVEGQPGVYAKTAITNARQLQTDTAIPTLEGMGTGDKGDWLITGPAGERYIVEGHKFNEFYRAVPKPADASPSFEFQKKAAVRAEVSKEPFEWTDWQGQPKTAKAGDWKVTQPDGTISSVEPSIFAKTYSEVPGRPGEYAKTAITNAQQLKNPTVINTKEGLGVGNRGDWLVTGPEGEQYIIEAKKFDELYRPAVGKVQDIPPPYKIDVATPPRDYIKTAVVKAEMVTADNFKWTNHDAAVGHQEQVAKKGDFIIYPADGSAFYVADGDVFRQNYHDMPGFPGKYAKTQAANAQVLDGPASVNNPDQGVTNGVAGDYLVTDKNGLQYIVPKAKFESQYAPREAAARAIEPMHIPPDTSPSVDMGDGTMHSTWEKGDIIRNTKDNSILVQNNETGEYQYYQGGRIVEEKRVIDAGDVTKHQIIRYPYQDIDSVSRLPSPQEYNEALLNTEYQGQSLKQVKQEAMSMPDTIKDPSIVGTPELLAARQELQRQAVETRWNQLLSGEDATAKELDFGPPKQEKKARILMGLTGSGKTSSGMADLKGKGYMVLESDELKPMLPEYKGGIGANALRNESNMLNDQLLDRAIADGYNFVLPGVGTNAEWMKETIKKLADAGWQVDLVFVDIPPAESMTRVVSRFQKEGRFVDPGFLVTHGHVPAQNYRQVVDDMFVNGSGLTGYRHVWNYGRRPITLEEGSIH